MRWLPDWWLNATAPLWLARVSLSTVGLVAWLDLDGWPRLASGLLLAVLGVTIVVDAFRRRRAGMRA